MSIHVSEVTKYYGEQKALDAISFNVQPGEIVGFIGPNGAGKSTTMKIITGFIPPSSGSITVNGLDCIENSLEVRRQIGYLPENNPLYLSMYVREYLEYVAGIYRINNKPKAIAEIMDLTGLIAEGRKKIGQLSKGYRQRVGLAQALIHNPSVLILDEPTSGLDPNQIIEIRALIKQVGSAKTVLLSTHLMQEVEAICDRIIIINQGRIVADGIKNEIYSHLKEKVITINIEFSDNVSESDLKTVHGVLGVRSLGINQWLIEADDTVDIRPALFNFAVQKNISVLSMQKKEKKLEEVFKELTSK